MDRTGVDEVELSADVEEDRVSEVEVDMPMEFAHRHIPRPQDSITTKQTMPATQVNLFTQHHTCPPRHTPMGNRKDIRTTKAHPRFPMRNIRSRQLRQATHTYLTTRPSTKLRSTTKLRHICKDYRHHILHPSPPTRL